MRHRAAIRCMLVATMLLSSLSWGGCDRKPDAPKDAPNVLIIAVDTLRADKLGCYGNTLGLTPNIDAMAEEGVLFDQAFSHAPWTLPAFASILTSTYPATHGAGGREGDAFKFTGVNPLLRTLPECFRDQGYETGAIVNVLFLSPTFKINRGFENYDFQPPTNNQQTQRRATEVTDRAIAWIQQKQKDTDRPYCLMVHYFDPHLPYDPPEEFRKKFARPIDRKKRHTLFGTESDMIALRDGKIDPRRLPMKRLEALYNGEVAYTDAEIGRLLQTLDEMKSSRETIVVFTADHGEEFMDHGGFEHGHTLYDELLHIPLIIRQRERIKPQRVLETVGHIDMAPTLCEMAGVKPGKTFRGRDLSPLLHRDPVVEQPVLSQGNMWGPSLDAWRQSGYKLIRRPIQPKGFSLELYHVVKDPDEQRNMALEPAEKARCEAMLERLKRAIERAEAEASKDQSVRLKEAEKKNLRSTGYVGSSSGNEDEALPERSDSPTSAPTETE